MCHFFVLISLYLSFVSSCAFSLILSFFSLSIFIPLSLALILYLFHFKYFTDFPNPSRPFYPLVFLPLISLLLLNLSHRSSSSLPLSLLKLYSPHLPLWITSLYREGQRTHIFHIPEFPRNVYKCSLNVELKTRTKALVLVEYVDVRFTYSPKSDNRNGYLCFAVVSLLTCILTLEWDYLQKQTGITLG